MLEPCKTEGMRSCFGPQVVVVFMSVGFIVFVTVLHIVGKVILHPSCYSCPEACIARRWCMCHCLLPPAGIAWRLFHADWFCAGSCSCAEYELPVPWECGRSMLHWDSLPAVPCHVRLSLGCSSLETLWDLLIGS